MSFLDDSLDVSDDISFLICVFGQVKYTNPLFLMSCHQSILAPFFNPKAGFVQDFETPLVNECHPNNEKKSAYENPVSG